MNTLATIAWATIAAVAAWGLTLAHATTAINRLKAERRKEVKHWQTEAARARAHAAQLALDSAAWAAGCKQGREDVMTIMPLLVAAQQRLTDSHQATADLADSA